MEPEHPLIAARKHVGMSRDDLAKAANTTRVTIWRIETRQSPPSLELVGQIVAALKTKGVTISADAFLPGVAA